MTDWMRRRVSSDTGRLPLRAYETVLRDTPDRLAISPMFTGAPHLIHPTRHTRRSNRVYGSTIYGFRRFFAAAH
ncbi:hypothetical protein GCM10029978_060190 [Actinoallomurus acanthiterrae]